MISIKEDFRYFTHLTGKESVIPLSKARAKVYPSRIEVFSEEKNVVIDLKIDGPIKGFTHLLNIEKSRIEVFGRTKDYFHFYLYAEMGKVYVKLHRGKEVRITIDGIECNVRKGQKKALMDVETCKKPLCVERVSFGCYKKPLLENSIDRASKLYMLSQLVPEAEILDLEISHIEPLLVDLFSPKDKDTQHRNLGIAEIPSDVFSLFSTFKKKFRSYIILEENAAIIFLPKAKELPHAGRSIGLKCDDLIVDILWRKKKVIKVIITPLENCKKKVIFPANPEKYRIKKHVKEKGAWVCASKVLSFKKGERIFIDRITY